MKCNKIMENKQKREVFQFQFQKEESYKKITVKISSHQSIMVKQKFPYLQKQLIKYKSM